MSSRTKPSIVVLLGGPSAERDVSLVSGAQCAAALRGEGYTVTEIDAGDSLVEDSALAMDKLRTKDVFAAAGLPIAKSVMITSEFARANHPLPPPYVVKPYNEGSSVGVYIVSKGANGPAKLSAEMPMQVMAEEFVAGRELTTTVMQGRALSVTDIITDGWYDYDAKYTTGGSRHEVPADIPKDVFAACLDYAERAHKALGCKGISRTDYRWDDSKGLDGLILLETNTQPGMTPTSLAPEQAATCGISFGELCSWLVEDASCDR